MRVDVAAPGLRGRTRVVGRLSVGRAGVTATTFKIGTGLYLIVIAMLASSIGGYIAGRLRTGWVGVHSDEVYFQDTAHGFVAWAFASVLGAVLLATPAGSLIGGGLSAAGQGAAAAASPSGPMDGYVDALLRPDSSPAQAPNGAGDSRAEMVRLFTSSFRNGGELKPNDRGYVSKVVASQTGLGQADADKRVNDTVTQIKSDTDAARKATAQAALDDLARRSRGPSGSVWNCRGLCARLARLRSGTIRI